MNRVAPIKLYPIGVLKDGTIRLQSQLLLLSNRKEADFVLREDELYVWEWQAGKGFDFHKTDIPYEIVKEKKEMLKQEL